MKTFRTLLLILWSFGLALARPVSAAELRTALVMGVWEYTDPTFPALPGIADDVKNMSAKLRQLGFEVTMAPNPTLGQAKTAVDAFSALLKARKGVGLFYFSGHGCEHEGKNYLIPRGTRIARRSDLDDEALSAQRVLNGMEDSGAGVNLVFLDCCRNGLTKGAGGLAAMQASGTFIGFATASAQEANAGQGGSVYTQALINRLGTPGMSITDVHTLVTRDVKRITSEAGSPQIPFQYSGLDSVFFLVPKPGSSISGPDSGDLPPSPSPAPSPLPGAGSEPSHGISPGMVFSGNFSYGKSYLTPMAPVNFTLRIETVDAAGNFTGVTAEPYTGFGVSSDGRLYADVKGRISINHAGAVSLSYKKSYRGFYHPGATYTGIYSPGKKALAGGWSLWDPETKFKGDGGFSLQLQPANPAQP